MPNIPMRLVCVLLHSFSRAYIWGADAYVLSIKAFDNSGRVQALRIRTQLPALETKSCVMRTRCFLVWNRATIASDKLLEPQRIGMTEAAQIQAATVGNLGPLG